MGIVEGGYDDVTEVLKAVYRFERGGGSNPRLGKAVHRALEDLAAGTAPGISAYPIGLRNAIEGLHGWWSIIKPIVVGVEVAVFSKELRVAGRIDLAIQCVREGCACTGHGVELVDAKTGAVNEIAHVQVGSAYPLLWRARDFPTAPVCREQILSLHDGGYSVVPAHADPQDFPAALDWYRRLKRIRTAV